MAGKQGNDFETQLMGSEEPTIIKVPYQQDKRWSISSDVPDGLIYDGREDKKFFLCPTFLDYIDLQEEESYIMHDLRVLDELEMRAVYELEADEMRVAFRHHIRKTYKPFVILQHGVLYSAEKRVILESFGKLKYIYIQKINPHVVFTNYKTPPRKFHKQREALREIENKIGSVDFDSQNIEELVSEHTSPLPGPSSAITRTPTKKRTYAEVLKKGVYNEGEKKFCSVARKLDFPSLENTPVSKKPAIRPTTLKKVQTINFDLFDEKLFNLRYDRSHIINVNDVVDKPTDKSLEICSWKWKKDEKLKKVSTIGISPALFGDGFVTINFVKLANAYAGHTVNFSVREFQQALPVMLEAVCEGMEDLTKFHKEKAYKEALSLRLKGKIEEADKIEADADRLFELRMEQVEMRRNPLKETG